MAICHKETEDDWFTLCKSTNVSSIACPWFYDGPCMITKLQNRGPWYFTLQFFSFLFELYKPYPIHCKQPPETLTSLVSIYALFVSEYFFSLVHYLCGHGSLRGSPSGWSRDRRCGRHVHSFSQHVRLLWVEARHKWLWHQAIHCHQPS